MQVRIDRGMPLGVKAQIKGQVRNLIRQGTLRAGEPLPTVRDLATVLGVNRNTVAAAYKELVQEGVLVSVMGKGTYVTPGGTMATQEQLRNIFSEAFEQARDKGFAPQEVADFLLDHIASLSSGFQELTVLVVECNEEAARDIAESLRATFGVRIRETLIQNIEARADTREALLADVDIVVCGFNHLQEFLAAVPNPPVEVLGAMLKPNTQILKDLLRLPKGSRIGFTCVTRRSTEAFFTTFQYLGGQGRTAFRAGLDDQQAINEMLSESDVVYATHYAYERLVAMANDSARIVKVDLGVDPTSLELIRTALARRAG